jgi:hypothetical protein
MKIIIKETISNIRSSNDSWLYFLAGIPLPFFTEGLLYQFLALAAWNMAMVYWFVPSKKLKWKIDKLTIIVIVISFEFWLQILGGDVCKFQPEFSACNQLQNIFTHKVKLF